MKIRITCACDRVIQVDPVDVAAIRCRCDVAYEFEQPLTDCETCGGAARLDDHPCPACSGLKRVS